VSNRLNFTQKRSNIVIIASKQTKNKTFIKAAEESPGNLFKLTRNLPRTPKKTTRAPIIKAIKTKVIKGYVFFLSTGNVCYISGNLVKSASVFGALEFYFPKFMWNLANFHFIVSSNKDPETINSA